MSNFIGDDVDDPHAFIQWKGTNVCMDFYCECGAQCHFDGGFAYAVKCPHCGTVWEMPCLVKPRKMQPSHDRYWFVNAQPLEPDEDHSDEVVGADGVTRFVPHPVRDEEA
jgi:hypothetical protein